MSSRSLCKVTGLLDSYAKRMYAFTFLRCAKKEKKGRKKYGCQKLSDARLDYVLAKTLRRLVYPFFHASQPVSSFSAELLSRLTQICCTYGTRRIITLRSILLMQQWTVFSFSSGNQPDKSATFSLPLVHVGTLRW